MGVDEDDNVEGWEASDRMVRCGLRKENKENIDVLNRGLSDRSLNANGGNDIVKRQDKPVEISEKMEVIKFTQLLLESHL